MNELPKFSGRPLAETPEIDYLKGEFGEKFLEAYNSVVKEKYNDNGTLKVLKFSDNVVKGSSTYSSIIAADILRQNGLEIAKPVDIEFARKLYESNPGSGLNIRGHCYVDYGVVFRTVDSPNEYYAKKLEPQIRKALDLKKIKDPVVTLSADLDLVNDEEAPNGLGLNLRKGAKPFEAPILKILKKDGRFKSEGVDENTGLPEKLDDEGNRYLYTRDSGLSRLSLYGGLDLGSCWDVLAGSYSGGRVVAVKK